MRNWIFQIVALLICLCCQSCATRIDNNIDLSDQLNAHEVKSRIEKGVWLSLNHIRQENMMCVPTSAAMVLDYYGDTRSSREIRMRSLGRTYEPSSPFNAYGRTSYPNLIIGLRSLGYDWNTRSYECTEAGFRRATREVMESLDDRRPVLIDTALRGGHTVVVIGYDDNKRAMFFMDPLIDTPGIRAIDYEALSMIWHSRDSGWNGRLAMYTRAKMGHDSKTLDNIQPR
jgi:hypothetical protein